MKMRDLAKLGVGCGLAVGLLVLSGCDVARSARQDLAHLTGPAGPRARSQPAATPRPAATAATTSDPKATNKSATAAEPTKQDSAGDTAHAANIDLAGKSESEVRTLLGPPNSEEERAPGKTWHYRDGPCAVDVHLYPDVQTRQFGTLAYEVKSDDNTDEGKRSCLAHLRSRNEANVE
jgi:hypothetical protein